MIDFADLSIEVIENDGEKGVFKVGPLPRGYGHTLANSVRRVLLSSLSGGAVTSLRIEGVSHEYSTIKGVKETVVDMIMNLKGINFRCDSDEPQVVRISKSGVGDVTAGDLDLTESVTVKNPDFKVATITDKKTVLDIEMVVERGVGYRVADESLRAEAGRLPVDASFGPIERVMFNIDETRKGKKMDLDMVTLTVFTDGSINPADAVGEACDTLCSVFGKLMLLAREESSSNKTSSAKKVTKGTASESTKESASSEEVKKWPIEDLNISKRAKASLIGAGMNTVEDLVGKNSKELLEIPGFGEKALSEVTDFLKEYSLAE